MYIYFWITTYRMDYFRVNGDKTTTYGQGMREVVQGYFAPGRVQGSKLSGAIGVARIFDWVGAQTTNHMQ